MWLILSHATAWAEMVRLTRSSEPRLLEQVDYPEAYERHVGVFLDGVSRNPSLDLAGEVLAAQRRADLGRLIETLTELQPYFQAHEMEFRQLEQRWKLVHARLSRVGEPIPSEEVVEAPPPVLVSIEALFEDL